MKKQTVRFTATNVAKLENGNTRVNMSPAKEDSGLVMGNFNLVTKDGEYEEGKTYLVEITKVEEPEEKTEE